MTKALSTVDIVKKQQEDKWVQDFHISDDLAKAGEQYATIEKGDTYLWLSDAGCEALLKRFDDRYGDGGPRLWKNGS